MARRFALLLIAVMLVGACAPRGSPSPASSASGSSSGELIDLNLCYSAPTSTQSVPWYALENGLFEKYGLRVNLIRVQGSSAAVTTLITGDADICQAAGNSVVNAVAAGQDVVMIAGIFNTYPAVFVARPEIRTLEDLKGKRVGTGVTASASQVATTLALEHLGLDPAADVILVQIGEEPERVAAFRTSQIDAILTTAPYLHSLREEGVSELFDFGKFNIPYAHTSILTTRRFLEERRDVARSFMMAMIDAIASVRADPQGAKAAIASFLGLDVDADAADLADAYDNVVFPLVQEIPYPSLPGLQTLIDFTAQTNPDAAGLDPSQLADASVVQELVDSGFVEEIGRR